jgi:hypothetical protein
MGMLTEKIKRQKKNSRQRLLAAMKLWLIIPVCLLSACAQTTPHMDATFGDAVKFAVSQQTLNPDASRNDNPVSGMDGRSAREVIERYQKSFKEPEPPPPVIFGFGGR